MTENVAAWMIAGGRLPTYATERELEHRRALHDRARASSAGIAPRLRSLVARLPFAAAPSTVPSACAVCR